MAVIPWVRSFNFGWNRSICRGNAICRFANIQVLSKGVVFFDNVDGGYCSDFYVSGPNDTYSVRFKFLGLSKEVSWRQ